MEKHSDLLKVIRTVFLVVGAIVVIGGIVYAVLKFLEPKEDDEYSFLRPNDDEDDEEDYQDDPDIAEEFDEEQ
ncbi:hypothetical protein ACTQ4Q_00015 [Bacillota bacterium LCP21S3_D9]